VGEDFFVSLVEVDIGLLVHHFSFALRNRDQWNLAEFFKSAHCTMSLTLSLRTWYADFKLTTISGWFLTAFLEEHIMNK
jgi:hypothetical protein